MTPDDAMQEWLAAHPPAEPLPRQLAKMYARYGRDTAHACGECAHLVSVRYAHVYYKCDLARYSRSAATDWRRKWMACGKWEAK